jgi:hypothetical protein
MLTPAVIADRVFFCFVEIPMSNEKAALLTLGSALKDVGASRSFRQEHQASACRFGNIHTGLLRHSPPLAVLAA